VVALVPTTAGRLIPLGFATLLIGFFAMAIRRKAVSQIVGLLLVDNGIALVAFLATSGVPLVVELGASLDVLLLVVVLRVLAARMGSTFAVLDLDQLRDLHD
jgi:hydrogenase-4 component E